MEKVWSVDVSVNGENIITIGSDWLSGKTDLTDEDNEIIKGAAESLLSFIGRPKIADLCSCTSFTDTYYVKGRRHCAICGKLENEQDLT